MAVHTDADKTTFTFVPASGPPIQLKYGEDYVTKDQTGAPITDLDAPIVFVGYGINAPEYEWNDFDGLDVKGKVLLVIVNQPRSNDKYFSPNKALTYYGRWTYKFEEAVRRGAAGVLIIHRTDLASYGWDVVRNSESTETSYLRNDPLVRASGSQLDTARCCPQTLRRGGFECGSNDRSRRTSAGSSQLSCPSVSKRTSSARCATMTQPT